MKIIVDSDNVLVDIVDSTEEVSNGIKVIKGNQEYVYADTLNLLEYDVDEIPSLVCPQKYLYENGEFVFNPNYRLSVEEINEQRLADLEIAMAAILGGVQ